MATKKVIYKSDIARSVHETVADMHGLGILDKETMRRFDQSCLTDVEPLEPEEIRELRTREAVSQAVFARYLNVTVGLISQWERW